MKVRYTNSWYDPDKEKEAAEKLIDEDKCKIISQHADSDGVPTVCENKGIPNVFYNSENLNLTKSYLISSRINWRPYFRYFIDNTLSKTTMEPDWTGHLKDGAVEVYNASSLAAEGTQDAVDQAIDDLKTGKINVFDTSKFTVDGKTLTSYKADVNTDPDSKKDTEVISNGIFQESHFRSSPYFDIIIDGIEEIKDKDDKDKINRVPIRIQKKGLNGGSIAGIVLATVASVISVAGIVGYTLFAVGAKSAPAHYDHSSLNKLVKL